MNASLDAVRVLNERLVSAETIGRALELAAGEDPPAWVFVFQEQIRAIRDASEAVEVLVRGGAA
jgi:hypothetical protein